MEQKPQQRLTNPEQLQTGVLYDAVIAPLGDRIQLLVIEVRPTGVLVINEYAQIHELSLFQLGLDGTSQGSIVPNREMTEWERVELLRDARYLTEAFRLETAVRLATFLGEKRAISGAGIYGSLARSSDRPHDLDMVFVVNEDTVGRNVDWKPPFQRRTYSIISHPGTAPSEFLFKDLLGLDEEAIAYISVLLHGGLTREEWLGLKERREFRQIGRAMKLDVQLWCYPMPKWAENALRKNGAQDDFLRTILPDLRVFHPATRAFGAPGKHVFFPNLR